VAEFGEIEEQIQGSEHGMVIVGVPYSTPGMLHTAGGGGTPYGATTVAGPNNERQPTPEELRIAVALGQRVTRHAVKLRSP
jgi:NAD(P)H dehydrogenase (quinone)